MRRQALALHGLALVPSPRLDPPQIEPDIACAAHGVAALMINPETHSSARPPAAAGDGKTATCGCHDEGVRQREPPAAAQTPCTPGSRLMCSSPGPAHARAVAG